MHFCQQEALDLSLHRSADRSYKVEQGDALKGTSNDSVSEHNQSVNMLGDNKPATGTPVTFDDLPSTKNFPRMSKIFGRIGKHTQNLDRSETFKNEI